MGKQKFSCKGVVRSTGQRAAIVIAAESKDAALEIAAKHGVAIESIVPVAEPTPPLKTAEKQPVEAKIDKRKLDARIEDILSAEDKELDAGPDDLDLDDDAGEASRRGLPTTKACPYCGEQILAVAVKCKHCGSYVDQQAAKPRQPLDDAAPSPGVPTRVWVIVAAVLVVAILVSVVAVVGWLLRGIPSTAPVVPVPEPVAAAPPATPAAPPAPPKPQAYQPSPEEVAFAGKLTAFLDSCDELAKLLDKAAKMDQFNKQCEAVKSRCREILPPPKGVAWASEAAASSLRFIDVLNVTTMELTTLDAAMEALHQAPSDSTETREALRKAAEELRKPLAQIRNLIPAECLTKPK